MDQSALDDVLECAVCLDRLTADHRLLPCQHTACNPCLDKMVAFAPHRLQLLCPECRMPVRTPVGQLPRNLLLVRLLDRMERKRSADSGSDSESDEGGAERDLQSREKALDRERRLLEREKRNWQAEELERERLQVEQEQLRLQEQIRSRVEVEDLRRGLVDDRLQLERDRDRHIRERQELELLDRRLELRKQVLQQRDAAYREERVQLDRSLEQVDRDRKQQDLREQWLVLRETELQRMDVEQRGQREQLDREQLRLEQERIRLEEESARQDRQRKRIAEMEREQRKRQKREEVEMKCVQKFFDDLLVPGSDMEVDEAVNLAILQCQPTTEVDGVREVPKINSPAEEELTPGCSNDYRSPLAASPETAAAESITDTIDKSTIDAAVEGTTDAAVESTTDAGAASPADSSVVEAVSPSPPRPPNKRRALEELQTATSPPKLQRVVAADDTQHSQQQEPPSVSRRLAPIETEPKLEIENLPPSTPTTLNDFGALHLVVANRTYVAKMASDLSYRKGDVITLHRSVDPNWFRGEANGRRGFVSGLHAREMVPFSGSTFRCRTSRVTGKSGFGGDHKRSPSVSSTESDEITVIAEVRRSSCLVSCGVDDKLGTGPVTDEDVLTID